MENGFYRNALYFYSEELSSHTDPAKAAFMHLKYTVEATLHIYQCGNIRNAPPNTGTVSLADLNNNSGA